MTEFWNESGRSSWSKMPVIEDSSESSDSESSTEIPLTDFSEFHNYFTDYTTLQGHTEISADATYLENSVATAETLFSWLQEGPVRHIRDLAKSLQVETVILGDLATNKVSHGFLLLPEAKEILVIQSCTGFYASYETRLKPEQLLYAVTQIREKKAEGFRTLFHCWDPEITEVQLEFSCTRRKKFFHPDRNSQKFRLDQLRTQFLTGRGLTKFSNIDNLENYAVTEIETGVYKAGSTLLYRAPDLFGRLLRMF